MAYHKVRVFSRGKPGVTVLVTAIVIGGMILAPSDSAAQRVTAKVTTILKTLPLDKQEKLRDFHERVENYINTYDWTGDREAGEIGLTMQILLEDISASSEERYKAQILVSNNTDLQYFDKRCRFAYQSGERILHQENTIDSLTGLLDYFVNLILGGKFDKLGTLEGTPYYEKAKNIAEQARYGLGRFVEGWDLREAQIKRILSDENKPFREMVDYYFYGLSFVNEDTTKARRYCLIAVDMIDKILKRDPDNVSCAQFLDAHHIEMVNLFEGFPDKSIFKKLIELDPDHEKIYQEHLKE